MADRCRRGMAISERASWSTVFVNGGAEGKVALGREARYDATCADIAVEIGTDISWVLVV